MINRFLLFLGPARARTLFFLLAITGLASLILNAMIDQYTWVPTVQTLLVAAFVVGSAIIIGGRMDQADRSRWIAILLPALGALVLGMTVLQQFALPLAGAAVGWIIAGLFIFRERIPMDYQEAIKFLRKNKISEAIEVIDDVIKGDPDTPNHYRFRAELLRLTGKLDKARRDYKRMTELAPESAEAYNGLAEVYLQMGNTDPALEAAMKAYELAPTEWVALYNLGMIEDRVGNYDDVIKHLQEALSLKVPDTRHRLLIHLYLTRAYAAKGDTENTNAQISLMRKHKTGLEEWQKILENEQAATLRAVIGQDVQTAQDIVDGTLTAGDLASTLRKLSAKTGA